MIKKAALILLSVIMLAAFCGCQLAVEDKGEGEGSDILCGMFITFEPLHHFQEGYVNDTDWNVVINSSSVAEATEGGRIYAVQKTDELGNADFVFEDIEGIRFFQVVVPGSGEQGRYSRAYNDSSLLSDVKHAINDTDEGLSISLEATMYLCVGPNIQKEGEDLVWYCNPVYETSDGSIYTVYGEGDSFYDPMSGMGITSTLSGEATWMENGETKKWSAKVELTVKTINDIRKYVFKEMDAQDNVLSANEIKQGSIPEQVTMNGNTEYAILETWTVDDNGNPLTQRSIVDLSSQYVNVKFPTQNGLTEGHGIKLLGVPKKS